MDFVLLLILLLLVLGVGELLLLGIGRTIANVIGFGTGETARPLWLSTIWYLAVGVAIGAMSLVALPVRTGAPPWLWVAILIAYPLALGYLVRWFACWFWKEPASRHGRTFLFAFCFAFSFLVVRLIWGQ